MDSFNTIKVIIADDHNLYREGLKTLLSKDTDIAIIAEAADGRALIELVKQFQPDVVLTDLKMPGIDGVQAIKEIIAAGCAAKCIALSTFDSDYLILEALEAGARGYIIKNAQNGEIIEAIKSVHQENYYYCKSTSAKLALRIARSHNNACLKSFTGSLTEKEKEIICLICQEKTNEEIGEILFMSKRTVESVRARLMQKINIKTTIGLVIWAIANGIYELKV